MYVVNYEQEIQFSNRWERTEGNHLVVSAVDKRLSVNIPGDCISDRGD